MLLYARKKINKTNKQKNILEHELYGGRLPICMAEGGCIRVHNVSRIKVDIFFPLRVSVARFRNLTIFLFFFFCSVIVILLICKRVKSNDMKKQSEGKTNSGDEKQAEARKAW